MKDTNSIGAKSEGAVLAALLASGKTVLMPFGVHSYDLVVEDEFGFHRVQVKTGREYKGALNFNAFSSTGDDRRTKTTYHGKADFFGVYLPTRNTCYLIPVSEVGGESGVQGWFRLEAPKNNQGRKVKYAEQYLIQLASLRAASLTAEQRALNPCVRGSSPRWRTDCLLRETSGQGECCPPSSRKGVRPNNDHPRKRLRG